MQTVSITKHAGVHRSSQQSEVEAVHNHHVDCEYSPPPNFLSIMKARLLQYICILNCFVASGFDTEEAIASMDTTTDGPENS